MQIREADNFLSIEVIERVPANLPTQGDASFAIEFRVEGFSGSGPTWVDLLTLQSFVKQLRALEVSRKGEAAMESMTPREFELRIWATDGLGHMALKGRLSHRKQVGEFTFSFDPSLLVSARVAFEAILNDAAQQSVQADGPAFGGSAA
ncbi:WapI family immunity protein [Methylomicrobium lacus]|uniref:WapI family immunity protein n=1 Tax=Methylomicrobium lacus TaxID=136992 RepID=UPI001267A780|nr:hypothetical protein [Methylomicrobium lacus]